jgi:hypothetical protein
MQARAARWNGSESSRWLAVAVVAMVFAACGGGGGGGVVDAGTPPMSCMTANECPAPANPCEVAVCVGGVCGKSAAPAGTKVPDATQVKGDCKKISCGEGGAFATAADTTDLPADDGNACTTEACDGPNPTHPNTAAGTTCGVGDAGAGGVCNGAGVCGECAPGSMDCSGNVPRTCEASGAWKPGTACPFVCSGAGQCTGECVPGAKDCQGKQPRLCSAQGQWANDGASCMNVCSAGACTGSCSPGSLQCAGNIPQSCDASGSWVSATACSFACVDGQCTGVCAPGANRCQGTSVQSCSAQGQWVTTTACPYVCASNACTGVCAPGAARCVGATAQTCDASGQWTDTTICQYACNSGSCGGVCVPGSTRCSGALSQLCDSQGQWQTSQTCPNACLGAGTCGGVCVPSSVRCSGSTSETCDAMGQWQGSACQFACVSGSCTGICTPGALRCSGNAAQTCSDSGQWQTIQTCPYVCSGGSCSGVCTPGATQCIGTIPQSCSSSGQWVSSTACPFACVSGACGGICAPGATRCSGNLAQLCDTQGQWQTSQTCTNVCLGAGMCGGVCVPGASRCMGNTVENCDSMGQWQGTACQHVCAGGACAGVCSPGEMRCNGNAAQVCSSAGQWQTTQNCPFVCSAGACGGVCLPGATQCAGNTPQSCSSSGQWVSGSTCGGTSPVCAGGSCSSVASCKSLLTALPTAGDGLYWIDPDGAGSLAAVELFCDMANGGWTLVANIYDSAGDDAPNSTSFVETGWQQTASGQWSNAASKVSRDTSGAGSSAVSLSFVAALKNSAGQQHLKMCFVHQNGMDTVCRSSDDGGLSLVSYATGNPRLTTYAGNPLAYTFGRLAGLAGSTDSYNSNLYQLTPAGGGTYCVGRLPDAQGTQFFFGWEGGDFGLCERKNVDAFRGVWHGWGEGSSYSPWDTDASELRYGPNANPTLQAYGFRLYVGP